MGVGDFADQEGQRQQHQRGDQIDHRTVVGHRRAAVGGTQLAGQNRIEGIEKDRNQNENGAQVKGCRTGPNNQEDAKKANAQRQPAADPHGFAQQQDRQKGDHQRTGIADRRDFGQR